MDTASNAASGAGLAFGVDERRKERYSLRQARYDALAHDVDALAGEAAKAGRRLELLDIGGGGGPTWKHLKARPNCSAIDLDECDLDDQFIKNRPFVRNFFQGDFSLGYPQIPSDAYNVVICEQVLEHLHEIDAAMACIGRVLKPGGRAFVGVPIFFPPLHLARQYIVPTLDRLTGHTKPRTHVQAFSLATFKARMLKNSGLTFVEARGFRIISGGILRPLENYRSWWRFNRWLGRLVPSACIEIQMILDKPKG